MRFLFLIYQISIFLYGVFIHLMAPFNSKAKKWVSGRKNWRTALENIHTKGETIWIHCASLGEFEQGRNLIDQLKSSRPKVHILVSFFSPSGYEIRKHYKNADTVVYLPIDSLRNAKDFIELVQPQLAIFVKYELWFNYLNRLHHHQIPHILISARVGENSPFLTSFFAPLYKNIFQRFSAIFTQDEGTQKILTQFSANEHIFVSYDTRYDRVSANKAQFQPIQEIEDFKGDRLCMVAGSSWPKDDEVLLPSFLSLAKTQNVCLIIAPHEIKESYLKTQLEKYPGKMLLYSQIDQFEDQQILWINNIGMLSRLYYYADWAYIGGAWSGGLHNILEPTTFGCPVIFGPRHEKFPEATELIQAGGGFSVESEGELYSKILKFSTDDQLRAQIHRINTSFIDEKTGATDMILQWIEKEVL